MNHARSHFILAASLIGLGGIPLLAGDWSQFRGEKRDGIVADFQPPKTWPKELSRKWKTAVGIGVATPALVGDKLYAFGRQGDQEVTACIDAAEGKVIWTDKYATNIQVGGPASGYQGPRSSPAVADGKVVTLDEGATLSCLDAATGKKLWRKDFTKDMDSAWPKFNTALSPLVTDGLCIAFFGGQGGGRVVALDLTTGEQKWKWDGDGPSYASPVLMTIGDSKQLVQETEKSVVGLSLADGKLLWQTAFGGGGMRGGPGGGGGGRFGQPGGGNPPAAGPNNQPPGGPQGGPPSAGPGGGAGPGGAAAGGGGGRRGRGGGGGMGGGMSYNAATPVVDGSTIILTSPGTGTKAFKIEKADDKFTAKELWTNQQMGGQFATPVVKDGRMYGISGGGNLFCLDVSTGKTLWTGQDRIGDRGFGTLVSAGPVMMALSQSSDLTVFKPSEKGFEEIARLKVADTQTNAYPVVAGNRIFIKDKDSVLAYTIE